MRFYNISVTNANGSPYQFTPLGGLPLTSLLPNGNANPAALNIELDLPVAYYHVPDSGAGAWLRVWGLGVEYVGALNDLNGLGITISAGMSKGLPLANPAQQGVLVKGQIYQAFGNWLGTDQTLDLLLMPPTGTIEQPKNIILNWPAGAPLATALAATLTTAFPGVPQSISISPNLILTHDEKGYYPTFGQFASLIYRLSKSINPAANYSGVLLSYPNGLKLVAMDSTATAPTPKQIAFTDLIGQPTWLDGAKITFQTVMRGDLSLGDVITLPPTLFTIATTATPGFNQNIKSRTAFSGNFQIQAIRHIGNFRQPDAASWNSTFQATTMNNSSGS